MLTPFASQGRLDEDMSIRVAVSRNFPPPQETTLCRLGWIFEKKNCYQNLDRKWKIGGREEKKSSLQDYLRFVEKGWSHTPPAVRDLTDSHFLLGDWSRAALPD
ncbi:hypothetical protein ABW19_dt0208005 [Dactylella cylindrospora]|nr:hypothetical protein ABW19_dt0208005 [Dactylella cylindrospora]